MNLNLVVLEGRLGTDPEIKYTPSGAAVTNFTLATSEYWTDKSGTKQQKTEWHKIVVWGKQAEACSQYLAKGKTALVQGKLQTRSWEDKNGQKRYVTEINAVTVQFGGGQSDMEKHNKAEKQQSMLDQDYEIESNAAYTASDIPF